MSKKTERHKRLPLTVDQSVLQKIRMADSPKDAATIVAEYPYDEAVSIIDNLDPLTAAFMIAMFQNRSTGDLFSASICPKEYADSLLLNAYELQIRGTLGLCHARDQVYRETGFLAGI